MSKKSILLGIFFLIALPYQVGAATLYVNSSTGNDSTGNGSSDTPYLTFTKAYASSTAGDTINLTGTFTWTDSGETGDAANTGFTIGKNLTIVGQGADTTIVQAATASTSADRRVFTISSGVNATITDLNIRNAKVSSSYYGGGIANNGSTTLLRVDVNNNISGAGGAGIDNLNLLYIKDSTVRNNLANGSTGMGAGILSDYYIVAGGYTTIENTTIAYNRLTATTGYTEGGGVHFRKGSGSITNSTIVYNHAHTVGGVGLDDPNSIVTIKNTIVASSTGNWNYDFGFRQSGYGVVVDNGYNVVGKTLYYSGWTGTGDWTDTNVDGTFNLYGSTTTGVLGLATSFASNSSLNKTDTLALSSNSLMVDRGANGTNGASSTVSTNDQRGLARFGVTDIGAYEYGASAPDTTVPVISSIASTTATTTATITWTTDEAASSIVSLGLSSTYSTTTTETDTSTRVTSHSVTLTGLISCALYHYQVKSNDASSNLATSSDETFLTTGCTADSSVATTSANTITTAGGGSLTADTLSLTVPTSFTGTSSQAVFQINKLNNANFFSTTGLPSGKNNIGTTVYNLKAFTDATTTLSSFSAPLTVSLSYDSGDVANVSESSLWIYRYDSDWNALSDCVVDTDTRTVTCTTTNFSDFALFGTGNSSGGCSTVQYSEGNITYQEKCGVKTVVSVNPAPSVSENYQTPLAVKVEKNDQATSTGNEYKTVATTTANPYQFNRDLFLLSTGEDVKMLQKFLNSIGFLVSKQGPGSPNQETEMFGSKTKLALVNFQKTMKINPAYGYFGPITRTVVNVRIR